MEKRDEESQYIRRRAISGPKRPLAISAQDINEEVSERISVGFRLIVNGKARGFVFLLV